MQLKGEGGGLGHSRERIPGSVREENDGVGYRIYASINALEGEGGLGIQRKDSWKF